MAVVMIPVPTMYVLHNLSKEGNVLYTIYATHMKMYIRGVDLVHVHCTFTMHITCWFVGAADMEREGVF